MFGPDWIVGREEIIKFLGKKTWQSARRWIKRYKPPERRTIDNRPAFYAPEFNEWMIRTGNEIMKQEKSANVPPTVTD